MGVNAVFHFQVADVSEALTKLLSLGFIRSEDGVAYEDPAPPVVGQPGELARRYLCRGFVKTMSSLFDAMERSGLPVSEAQREPWRTHLCYTTFYRWPLSPGERVDSLNIVRRVSELCRALGAVRFLCVPDSVACFELSDEELCRHTHAIGETDADLIFAD